MLHFHASLEMGCGSLRGTLTGIEAEEDTHLSKLVPYEPSPHTCQCEFGMLTAHGKSSSQTLALDSLGLVLKGFSGSLMRTFHHKQLQRTSRRNLYQITAVVDVLPPRTSV